MKNWIDLNSKIKIFKIVTLVTMFLLMSKLAIVGVYNNDGFNEMAKYQTTIETAAELPRGEIYDRNNNLVVGSVNNKALMYIESDLMTSQEKMETAQTISATIDVGPYEINDVELTDLILSDKDYQKKVKSTWTDQEKTDAIGMSDSDYLTFSRGKVSQEIKDEYINQYGGEAVYIRCKMMSSTKKTPVVIKSNLTIDELYAIESMYGSIGGFYVTDDWVRTYPYGDSMRSFLGNCSSIPEEEVDVYLSKGYSINDEVGVSYLEKELEPILHSKPETVEFYFDENGNIINSKTTSSGVAGSDVVLTIDMQMQMKVEAELRTYINNNSYVNNHSAYATIIDPRNGDILVMAGQVEVDGEFYDNSIGNFTQAYTMGSILKPAVLLAAYDSGTRKWGDVIVDEPMIIPGTPVKQSYTNMGPINEMQAIAFSSNVYFYKTVLNMAGVEYVEGEYLDIEYKYFDILRQYFQQFGLGTSTGINMSNETVGFTGSGNNPGLYMDLANGQYDTYTPLQTAQYVSTIANGGTRYKTEYIKSINKPSETSKVGPVQTEQKATVLNELTMSKEDINHVQDAMEGCLTYPSSMAACKGKGFEKTGVSMGGKTGTSETFYYDPVTKTTVPDFGSSFIGFFPAENPEYAISVTVPNFTNNKNTASVVNATDLGSSIMNSIYRK